jgi:iron complex transport system substrate-binding protein
MFIKTLEKKEKYEMKRKIFIFFIIAVMFVTVLAGCSNASGTASSQTTKASTSQSMDNTEKTENENTEIVITDMLGRTITLENKAQTAIAIGPGGLRLYCYVADIEKLAGIEQIEKDSNVGRPYNIANPKLQELETVGPGGPNNQPDAEKLLMVNPDVIFSLYNSDPSAIENLQSKTGIPVIALSYGKIAVFDSAIYESLEIIGKVMGEEERATEVVSFMKDVKWDLNNRTKDISEEERPKAYIGALSSRGTHGIESTSAGYALFEAVNVKNVVDETGEKGGLMIDKEKLLEWNPDKIIIDIAGLSIVKEDYQKNPDFYNAISAVKNGQLYTQLPFNYYSTNIDTAIANAYFIGKVIYPEQFKDINPEKKADEIYEFFVGQPLYERMAEDFAPFGEVNLSQ